MSQPRRILLAITDLQVGGVPLHLLRLTKFLLARGWQVDVVSLQAGGDIEAQLEGVGATVHTCGATHAIDWRVFENLAGKIDELRPDLVHSFLFHANLACRVACQLAGFPRPKLLCEIQTVEIERRWHLWVDRVAHRFSRTTICNSESVMRHLHQRAGIPLDRLTVIPGGVDADGVQRATAIEDESWRAGDDTRLLLWVGRMDPIKGLDTLVDAVGRVSKSHAVKLLLVGDGPLRGSLEAQVAARGLTSVVEFLGQRSDVFRLIRTADLFVFPSRTEGMPNALLEAMAGGLPVVTTDVPGCRDLVTDGVTGRLVPPNDPARLSAAIAEAIDNSEATREMSAKAWHCVDQDHRMSHCHEAYERLYLQVLNPTQ